MAGVGVEVDVRAGAAPARLGRRPRRCGWRGAAEQDDRAGRVACPGRAGGLDPDRLAGVRVGGGDHRVLTGHQRDAQRVDRAHRPHRHSAGHLDPVPGRRGGERVGRRDRPAGVEVDQVGRGGPGERLVPSEAASVTTCRSTRTPVLPSSSVSRRTSSSAPGHSGTSYGGNVRRRWVGALPTSGSSLSPVPRAGCRRRSATLRVGLVGDASRGLCVRLPFRWRWCAGSGRRRRGW